MKKAEKTMWRRDFTLVVIGQVVSLFGNAVLRFALPLWLLRETGSPALFGMVTAVSFIPMIALSLMGGVLADRVNKRNIMVGLDFLTAGLITAFYSLQGRFPTVPLIIAALMLLYAVSGAYQPAVQASIPALVEPEPHYAGERGYQYGKYAGWTAWSGDRRRLVRRMGRRSDPDHQRHMLCVFSRNGDFYQNPLSKTAGRRGRPVHAPKRSGGELAVYHPGEAGFSPDSRRPGAV